MSNPRDRPRRRVDMQRRVSESGEEICAVCSDIIKYFAFGECDHPICYKCSTRMRVLCEQLYCAICRADLPKVTIIYEIGGSVLVTNELMNKLLRNFCSSEHLRLLSKRTNNNKCITLRRLLLIG